MIAQRLFTLISIIALSGCAAPTKTSVAPPPKVAALGTPKAADYEITFNLALDSEWETLDPHDAGLTGSTPDYVIANKVTGAKVAFLWLPAVLGTPSTVATATASSAQFAAATRADVVAMYDGSRADFTFTYKKDGEDRKGEVIVMRVTGVADQIVMIRGTWPASQELRSIADLDVIAATIEGKPIVR